MTDPRDYQLQLSDAAREALSSPTHGESNAHQADTCDRAGGQRRPFLSVYFACCGVHQRIYRDPSASAYHGRCPRCAKPVRFLVGQGGVAARQFIVR